ncbi:MAG TPA: NAD(P)-binding domain-containing protein, partial [Candidatus Dormibacteraeota bacterium]|nr:NAD(P)-binding domain-containing protein [Candidatus Dormibacteraeota bacterium]
MRAARAQRDHHRMTAETPIDTVGIIGAGSAGQAFARVAQRASRKVVIANSHGPQSLAAV